MSVVVCGRCESTCSAAYTGKIDQSILAINHSRRLAVTVASALISYDSEAAERPDEEPHSLNHEEFEE